MFKTVLQYVQRITTTDSLSNKLTKLTNNNSCSVIIGVLELVKSTPFEIYQSTFRLNLKIIQQLLNVCVSMKGVYTKVSIYSDTQCMSAGHHTSTDGYFVCSEKVGSAWRCLEHMCSN